MDVHLLGDKKITIINNTCQGTVPRNYTTNYFKSKRKKQVAEEVQNKKSIITRVRKSNDEQSPTRSLQPTPELTTYGGIKLGWIQGVLIPCLLNIWGSVLFLRMGWIVAQAGTGITMGIIAVSGVVCIITTLSLSAICTNGQLKGGGVYYLVSRSLGAELGASVGVIFAVANAVAASMNTIGFCDSLNDLLSDHHLKIIDNGINDKRIVGAIALLLMCMICAIGMDWETKTQNFLIVIIVLAIFNFIIGAAMGPQKNIDVAKGFVGVSLDVVKQNAVPDFRYSYGSDVNHDVFTVFAIYFPAVTGVQAGANICGDLKDPATAIPKGTLLALGISMFSYALIAMLCGAGALRHASGIVGNLTHEALASCAPHCKYGLHNDYEVMQIMSLWGPLIYGGCWAATLSTALTNLLSVPRLIQALGTDRIYPGLIFFSKPYGKHGEPYRGYVLTFFVSLMFLLIADLDTIAPLITNFYLASYTLINFCTFHAAFVQHISWRPTFRCYNKWLSLLGAALCGVIMMLLSWPMAMITMFAFIVLYMIVHYRKPDADWGSSTEAQQYLNVIQTLVAMSHRHSVKSYNPQVLVLAGPAGRRPALLHMAGLFTRGSYYLLAEINESKLSQAERESRIALAHQWLTSTNQSGFYTLVDGVKFEAGVRSLLQAAGLGRLAPNILLMGYKYDWMQADDTETYVRVIRLAFEYKLGVTILRSTAEQRASVIPAPAKKAASLTHRSAEMRELMFRNSEVALGTFNVPVPKEKETLKMDSSYGQDIKTPSVTWKIQNSDSYQRVPTYYPGNEPPDKPSPATTYKPMQLQHGSVDAWWLYDDGGLNILLPYIIARRGAPPVRLRVLALTRGARDKDAETRLASMLKKFRITYDSLTLLSGEAEPPGPASWDLFHSLIRTQTDSLVAEEDVEKWHAKTSRQLRLRELLVENSSKATFIVMNLPMVRKEEPPHLYMAWLEMLSRDLPPMLFVRGNDRHVLSADA